MKMNDRGATGRGCGPGGPAMIISDGPGGSRRLDRPAAHGHLKLQPEAPLSVTGRTAGGAT